MASWTKPVKTCDSVAGADFLSETLLQHHCRGVPLSFPVVPSQKGSGLQSPLLTCHFWGAISLIPERLAVPTL